MKRPDHIKIGKYTLEWVYDFTRKPLKSLWISTDGGEGGEFNEEDIEALIDQFYMENF